MRSILTAVKANGLISTLPSPQPSTLTTTTAPPFTTGVSHTPWTRTPAFQRKISISFVLPLPAFPLLPLTVPQVIGGEAHMWAEQTDPINIDRMIWPRGCAVAEVLWSGAKDSDGRNRSQIEASPRLSEMRERLVAKGIGAEPIQMPYCTMEGTVCQLGWEG